MNPKRFFRQVHYWLSLIVFLPSGIIIAAGIVLMLKKEVDWIQPPTKKGEAVNQIPAVTYDAFLDAARAQPQSGIQQWKDIKRIDIRPSKGIAKVTSKTGWEVQIDTSTGDVLNTAVRRSDWIESIHDGSFFTSWMKLYVFLPTGILLLTMWATGIYLFLIPRLARMKRRPLRGQSRDPKGASA